MDIISNLVNYIWVDLLKKDFILLIVDTFFFLVKYILIPFIVSPPTLKSTLSSITS